MAIQQKNAQARKDGMQFIQSAKAFEKSEIERVKRTSKIAWKIAGFCLLLTGVSVGAVAFLTPLKTVEPFVIRVDNNTGATDVVTMLKSKEQTYGEVMDKYWLTQYIRYRESYDWQTIQDSYNATMLLSAQPIQTEFSKLYGDNPNAVHKVLKDNYKIMAKVKAVSFVGNMAQIRFDKITVPMGGDISKQVPPQSLIATVGFEYVNAPQKEEDRSVNPLGFQITSYRVDPEN
jgi:type IV secretion system protein VirB8